MPCQGGPSGDETIYRDFDEVTQLLCSLCKITNKKKNARRGFGLVDSAPNRGQRERSRGSC